MPADRARQLLSPVGTATVVASFALALLFNFLPWPNVLLVPDFVALLLAFWCVHEPRRIGLATGWALGLLVDAGNGVLLGQHALAYSALAFSAIALSRRILWFDSWGQALHVLLLLEGAQLVALVVRMASGAEFPGWTLWVGPAIGALLWPAVSWALHRPRRRLSALEETRSL